MIESLFSSVKRKLSARPAGSSLRMQMRQALLLGLSLDLYYLKHQYPWLRMSTEPNSFGLLALPSDTGNGARQERLAYLKVTICMTQGPAERNVAVALLLPAAVTTLSSAISPS